MKLSILDQAPIVKGKSAKDALEESVNLAQLGERLGYHRYWIAEHHDLNGLACPAPEVMLGAIGIKTTSIRIGAGAILLPHYKPYKVAETFNLLATLYPGRVDLGLGRSPGGSAEASVALSGNFLENVRNMPEAMDELLHFFHQDFNEDNLFSKIKPTPVPDILPVPWLLGTSGKSAVLAAEKGMNYAFGHFMSDQDVKPTISTYRQLMKENHPNKNPNIILAVNIYCAQSSEEAERLAYESFKWSVNKDSQLSKEQEDEFNELRNKMIIGNPTEVKATLYEFEQNYQVSEFMVLTNTPTYESRNKSYELLAEAILMEQ
ncbi:LLM class flavin-dependent oxidoreductase [Ornithinibacillus sp. 179-J 7C1 HS]|uniref:LLM class flavin-dependent oxidoreductase n=1 Tax=Ornithinibacillus sp. 179-J 7C1 HS TaxID=3142384 RepID=UPI0039A066FA